MTTTVTPAADTGLPDTNRRRLLLGLAAASTAAAGSIASAATPALENPELLRLGDQLEAKAERHCQATAHENRIVREGRRRWPTTPEALFRRDEAGDFRFRGFGEIERDFDGGRAYRPGEEEPRLMYGRWEALRSLEHANDALASKWMARNGKLYGVSRAEWERRGRRGEGLGRNRGSLLL
jgi:hypothetical protein